MKEHVHQQAINIKKNIDRLTDQLARLNKGKSTDPYSTDPDPTLPSRIGSLTMEYLHPQTLSTIYELVQTDLIAQLEERRKEFEAL